MYSQAGNRPSAKHEKPRKGNNVRGNSFRERAGRDMRIICHNCGKKGHKKRNGSQESGQRGQTLAMEDSEEEAETQAEEVIPEIGPEMETNLRRRLGVSMKT